ncbi:DUF6879 family protein [Streptomyces sp. NPDC056721]|uniref:DUF6879 family protein n=1 Tax=Streptomyces sp. NPDC056721 TaxID=3345923 RepID=UPI0036968C12
MPSSAPPFPELIGIAQHSAVHLEMRDAYGVTNEADDFARWRATGVRDVDPQSEAWGPWTDLIKATVARDVTVRRARIVSEPVSDYIRYEHGGTVVNVAAGEQVRWLPRRRASGIALPGNDFWLFDGRLIRWNHFTGAGLFTGAEVSEDPAEAKLCTEAFETVWDLAIPHDQYEIN